MTNICGIIGTINIDNKVLTQLLKKLSLRGRDGYGYYMWNKELNVKRKSTENVEVSNLDDIFPRQFVTLANSRAVPTTEYESGAGFSVFNQQPFETERFVVVHNGIIANDKELIKEYNLEPTAKVDSAILPCLFEKVGVVAGLKLLKGSFAIICFDIKQKILYAAKNFMPLGVVAIDSGLVFISMEEMSDGIEGDGDIGIFTELVPYTCIEMFLETKQTLEHSLYPRKRNKRVLVICSSGADSATTAFVYKYLGYEVGLIHFKYSQAAEKVEEECVKRLAKKLGADLFIYDAKSIFGIFKQHSLLLSQKKANKKDQMLDAESTLSYVPNRNAIMAMVSAGVAEMNHYDTLSMGLQQMDSVYPDNNPTMVTCADNLLKYSLNWGTNIHFTAPLVHLIKHEIFSLGDKLGIDFINDSVSCYYPKLENGKIIPCHDCGCCQFKDSALKMIKEKDFIGNIDKFINKYVQPFI